MAKTSQIAELGKFLGSQESKFEAWAIYILASLLFLLGLAASLGGVAGMFLRSEGRSALSLLCGLVCTSSFLGLMVYSARFIVGYRKQQLAAIRFFEEGVEFGPLGGRQRVRFEDLRGISVTVVSLSVKTKRRAMLSLLIAAVTLDGGGLGAAWATFSPRGLVTFRPPGKLPLSASLSGKACRRIAECAESARGESVLFVQVQ